jgi:hypothetical protein
LPDEIPYGLTVVEGAVVNIVPQQLATGLIGGQITLSTAVVDTSFITVTIRNLTNEFIIEIEPDASGTVGYEVEVPIGVYDVIASYPEYETISYEDVFVDEQQTANQDFFLFRLYPPFGLAGELEGDTVILNWQLEQMRDFQFFNIYRNIAGTVFTLLDTTSQMNYINILEIPNVSYGYYITAVYAMENESSASEEIYIDYFINSIEDENIQSSIDNIQLSNYPHPFNPETIISFNVSQGSNLTEIEIYNIRGQKVDQLSLDSAQVDSVIWDASEFSSGIYFCKLTSGKESITHKMLLLK